MPDAVADGLFIATGQSLDDWSWSLQNDVWTYSPLLWVYLAVGIGILSICWWMLRCQRPVWRAIWRSGAAAFLFSPAILACGHMAVMPLPVLLARAWHSPSAISCGAPLVALPPNLMTFAGLWLTGFLALWAWQWMRRPAGAQR